jgi:hypothetical protein
MQVASFDASSPFIPEELNVNGGKSRMPAVIGRQTHVRVY